MGLISTWLTGIGVGYANAAFKSAGIVSPAQLASLTLADYDELGIVDVNDRKKLFYLVQRIKMAVNEAAPGVAVGSAAATNGPASSSSSVEKHASPLSKVGQSKAPPSSNPALQQQRSSNMSNRSAASSAYDAGSDASSDVLLGDDDDYDDDDLEEEEDDDDRRRPPRPPQMTAVTAAAAARAKRATSLPSSPQFGLQSDSSAAGTSAKAAASASPISDPLAAHIASTYVSPIRSPKRGYSSGSRDAQQAREGEKGAGDRASPKGALLAGNTSSQLERDDGSAPAPVTRETGGKPVLRGRIQEPKVNKTASSLSSGVSKPPPPPPPPPMTTMQRPSAAPPATSPVVTAGGGGYTGRDGRDPSPIQLSSQLSTSSSPSYSRSESEPPEYSTPLLNLGIGSLSSHRPSTSGSYPSAAHHQQQQQQLHSARPSTAQTPPRHPPRQQSDRVGAPTLSSNSALPPRSGVASVTRERSNSPGRSYQQQHQYSSRRSSSPGPDGRSSQAGAQARGGRAAERSPEPAGANELRRPSSPAPADRRDSGGRYASNSNVLYGEVASSSSQQQQQQHQNSVYYQSSNMQPQSWQSFVENSRDSYSDPYEHEQPSEDDEDNMRIRVIVRKRPLSTREAGAMDVDVIQPLARRRTVMVHRPQVRVDLTKEIDSLRFVFDNVFNERDMNDRIYDCSVRNLIPGVFEGGRASVFAYGQTGSGKTFTMMGSSMTGDACGGPKHDETSSHNLGLYYMAAQDVFAYAQSAQYRHLTVTLSLFEIYGGKLFDLLNERKNIKCLEDAKQKVCFLGLSEHVVQSAEQVMQVIEAGASQRSTGTTSANADSSRSHAVLQLSLKKAPIGGRRRASAADGSGASAGTEHGRLTFIDLAGSERGADTNMSDRQTRLEGAEINTSLLALKEVIRALATGDTMQHIPFRGSKLTQVLKDSFVGENARSVMIACVAPNLSNCEHTLNTLRYADRVKEKGGDAASVVADREAAKRRQDQQQGSGAGVQLQQQQQQMRLQQQQKALQQQQQQQQFDVSYKVQPGSQSPDRRPFSAPAIPRQRTSGGRRSLDDGGMLSSALLARNSMESQERDRVAAAEASVRKELADKNKADEAAVLNKVRAGIAKRTQLVAGRAAPPEIAAQQPEYAEKKVVARAKASLASPQLEVGEGEGERRRNEAAREKREAALRLVAAHRKVMTGMLGMVKREMTMVNATDADRDNIENYLDDLEELQREKIDMLEGMGEALREFKSKQEAARRADASFSGEGKRRVPQNSSNISARDAHHIERSFLDDDDGDDSDDYELR